MSKETVHIFYKDGNIFCGWFSVKNGIQYDGRKVIKSGDSFAGLNFKELKDLGEGPHKLDLAKKPIVSNAGEEGGGQ